MKKIAVTGGAGFIASHLEDALVTDGYSVIAIDKSDASTNISHLLGDDCFEFIQMDINNTDEFTKITENCDMIFHLAANSDIRVGGQDPRTDYESTFMTTRSVLEAMRKNGIKEIFFSSTSAVYGMMDGKLNETTGELKPISYYGSYKLASESIISSYSYMNDFNALIFRFPNIVGPRLTHGVIFDFIKKLKRNQNHLEILGDGRQRKQYVYVEDLVKGIMDFSKKNLKGFNLFNISTNSSTNVDEIAELVCERMGLRNVVFEHTGGTCGWKGDVPSFEYDISKAESNGWKYRYDSTQSIVETLKNIDIEKISP